MSAMPRLFALIVCSFLFVAPVLAQEAVLQPGPEDEETTVLFAVNAPLTEPMETELPVALLERLAEEPALVQLDLSGAVGEMMLRGRFAFESMEAFADWYGSEETRALMEELTQLAPHMEYSFQLRRTGGASADGERQL